MAPKSWVSGTDNGGAVAAFTAPVYGAGNDLGTATYGTVAGVLFPAENNLSQAGISLSTSTNTNFAGFPAAAFSDASDEGLDVSTVSTIARLFTVANSTFFN